MRTEKIGYPCSEKKNTNMCSRGGALLLIHIGSKRMQMLGHPCSEMENLFTRRVNEG